MEVGGPASGRGVEPVDPWGAFQPKPFYDCIGHFKKWQQEPRLDVHKYPQEKANIQYTYYMRPYLWQPWNTLPLRTPGMFGV